MSGAGLALAATLPSFNAFAATNVAPGILRRALSALDRHGAAIPHRDVVALADFSQPSRMPRFHIVDLASGSAKSYLVAHGRGSDPGHTGWLQRFSNAPGSYATA
ncbi:MAG TPA: murein L,D-transpeptidase catalytic domain family protein, partial [Rhizomicrobium sp.]